jgi:GT2 family glycosyltransferase
MTTDAEPAVRPDISVIVVTHNRTDLALDTLRSARAAAGGLRAEWLVVDSGSTDDTPEVIERTWPDIRVARLANVGFAAANNHALATALGRYVLLLNPDCAVAEGTFPALLAELDSQPQVGIASVVQRAPDGSLQYSIRRYPNARLAFGEALAAARLLGLSDWREEEVRAWRYHAVQSVDWLVGAFLIARAEAIRDVGPLDTRFFLYSEEIDWCYRFRRAGWDVCHMPVMTVTHSTGNSYRPDLLAQLSYAKILFALKHYGPRRALAIRGALALRHALRAVSCRVQTIVRPERRTRMAAERHALAVVLGRSEPPFGGTPIGVVHSRPSAVG